MSKPMSEQMQKLAARYEKATGKKFNAKTNAQKIRAMSDEELAEFLSKTFCYGYGGQQLIEWLQQSAEEDDHDERKENENV